MGGNALSVKPASRMSPCGYAAVCDHIRDSLAPFFADDKMRIVPSYLEKDSHGDVDILVDVDDKLWEYLLMFGFKYCLSNRYAKVTEQHKNGKVVSLGLTVSERWTVQLDFIKVKRHRLHEAFVYYGYNDLGNLMGRVAAGMGFKYGPEGLSYRLYAPDDSSKFLGEIVVTTDLALIFEFLGYDYYQWAEWHSEGYFTNLERVFLFAASSTYANREQFVLANRNSADRRRDSKRSTYTKYLQWLENTVIYNPSEVNTEQQLARALLEFPLFRKGLSDRINKYDKDVKLSKRFNAHVVMRNVPVVGPELGKFIAYLKAKEPKENWGKYQDWFIDDLIQAYYKEYVNEKST